MEMLVTLIKTLPAWLSQIAEIILVALLFVAAVTFLAGIWVGICVVRRRARSITSFTLIPFRIEFDPPRSTAQPRDQDSA